MNIENSRGLGLFVFGMTEQQLVASLGPPDKVIVTEFNNLNLCYDTLQLVFESSPPTTTGSVC